MSIKDYNRYFVITDAQTQNCQDNIDYRLFEDEHLDISPTISVGDYLLLRSIKSILDDYHDVHIHNGYKSN